MKKITSKLLTASVIAATLFAAAPALQAGGNGNSQKQTRTQRANTGINAQQLQARKAAVPFNSLSPITTAQRISSLETTLAKYQSKLAQGNLDANAQAKLEQKMATVNQKLNELR